MFTRSASRMLTSILAVFITLCVLWAAAGTAHAAVYEETGCTTRPMVQGRVGENVTTCELARVPSTVVRTTVKARHVARSARRTGTTTVVHYGHRAPLLVAAR